MLFFLLLPILRSSNSVSLSLRSASPANDSQAPRTIFTESASPANHKPGTDRKVQSAGSNIASTAKETTNGDTKKSNELRYVPTEDDDLKIDVLIVWLYRSSTWHLIEKNLRIYCRRNAIMSANRCSRNIFIILLLLSCCGIEFIYSHIRYWNARQNFETVNCAQYERIRRIECSLSV